MAEKTAVPAGTPECPPGTTDAAHATTEIAYCPNLGLYHYRRADGTQFLFNRDELAQSVEVYLREGDLKTAEYMAGLTGHARRYPHVVVILNPDGTYELRRMEIPKDECASGIVDDLSAPTAGK
jgi:hypothetical protein